MLWALDACFGPCWAVGLSPLCGGHPRVCSCRELITLLLGQGRNAESPCASDFLQGCCVVSSLGLGLGTGPTGQGTFLPSAPVLPPSSFWFGAQRALRKHHLCAVFDWLTGDKHLSPTYISKYLFSFIDTVVNTFLRGQNRRKRSPVRGHEGQAAELPGSWDHGL